MCIVKDVNGLPLEISLSDQKAQVLLKFNFLLLKFLIAWNYFWDHIISV